MMVLSLYVTSILETISGAWAFIIEAGAGLGLVLILRWFWWRINAWSEIAAMVAPLAVCGWLHFATDIRFPETLYVIVAATTVAWVVVTFLTKPTDAQTLERFYRRVHPGGAGWAAVARRIPDVKGDSGYGRLLRDWLCGVILVYSVLFGDGEDPAAADGRRADLSCRCRGGGVGDLARSGRRRIEERGTGTRKEEERNNGNR